MTHQSNTTEDKRVRLAIFINSGSQQSLAPGQTQELVLGTTPISLLPVPLLVNYIISPKHSYQALSRADNLQPLIGNFYGSNNPYLLPTIPATSTLLSKVSLFLAPSQLLDNGATSLYITNIGNSSFNLQSSLLYVFIADNLDTHCRPNTKNPCLFFNYWGLPNNSVSPATLLSLALTIPPLGCRSLNNLSLVSPLAGLSTVPQVASSPPFVPDPMFVDADARFLNTTIAKCALVFDVYSPSLMTDFTPTSIANLRGSNFLGKVILRALPTSAAENFITLVAYNLSDEPLLLPQGAIFVSEGCCPDGDIQIIVFSSGPGATPP